jgi:hypothetical protein
MAKKEKEIQLCSHVKTNGALCESPALTDESFCFFHTSVRERTKRMRRAARHKLPFQLPVLEDAESIQLAIGDTLNALLSGQIDHKAAGLMLRGLQMAAANLRHTDFVRDENERGFDFYHNQEEEELERGVAAEIAEEAATIEAKPQVAATADPLPPKKEVAREEPVLNTNQDQPASSREKG